MRFDRIICIPTCPGHAWECTDCNVLSSSFRCTQCNGQTAKLVLNVQEFIQQQLPHYLILQTNAILDVPWENMIQMNKAAFSVALYCVHTEYRNILMSLPRQRVIVRDAVAPSVQTPVAESVVSGQNINATYTLTEEIAVPIHIETDIPRQSSVGQLISFWEETGGATYELSPAEESENEENQQVRQRLTLNCDNFLIVNDVLIGPRDKVS